MDHDRRYVLAAVTLVVGLLTAVFLQRVLATVFFAVTVAYLLAPVQEWYERRGLPTWWASVATTITGSAGVVAVFSPLVVVLYVRSDQLFKLVDTIPRKVTVSQFGYTTTITVEQAIPLIRSALEDLAVGVASAAPTIAIKLTVFVIVVFALLIGRQDAHDAVRAVVPLQYHDVLSALAGRAKDTLFAIYVLQAATAAVAFIVALPLFALLGYDYPFTLATIAGVLQFIPIVGPSVLVLAITAFEVISNDIRGAILVAVTGFVLLAYLPDPLVRPRLARRTADLPGSMYFVGFTGGLFTLGVVGVIAGPLLVALFVESVELLADEMDDHRDELDEAGGAAGDADVSGGDDDAGDTDDDEVDPPDPEGDRADPAGETHPDDGADPTGEPHPDDGADPAGDDD